MKIKKMEFQMTDEMLELFEPLRQELKKGRGTIIFDVSLSSGKGKAILIPKKRVGPALDLFIPMWKEAEEIKEKTE